MSNGLFSSSSRSKRNGLLSTPVEDQIEDLRHDIAALTKALAARGKDAGREVSARAHDARDIASDELSSLIASGEKLVSDLRGRFEGSERQVRHAVREHPIATVGVIALAGLAIVALIRR